jgi:hypothetical protein
MALYDPLGRTIETRQYEGGSNYIAVKVIPFTVLQDGGIPRPASQTSNPYRPYLSEQPIWTTSISDGLGRGLKVITPDNATITTSYSGNTVTVSDQMGKSLETSEKSNTTNPDFVPFGALCDRGYGAVFVFLTRHLRWLHAKGLCTEKETPTARGFLLPESGARKYAATVLCHEQSGQVAQTLF